MRRTLLLLLAAAGLVCLASAQLPAPAQTLQNLNDAYLGEAQASVFYTESARQALRDGYPDVAKLFRAAASSEAIHRNNHLRAVRTLGGTPRQLPPARAKIGSTDKNLAASVADEREESRFTYPAYIRTARREGSPAAERTFRFARETERAHARLFERALRGLGGKPATDYFVCQTCGMTTMDSVPAVCPVCRGSGLDYRKVE